VANDEKRNPEGIWSDPEAILQPTEEERLTSLIQEFEDERYPQTMALGWIKQALERLPQNQAFLTGLLVRSVEELASLAAAFDIGMDEAHRMLSECTGEPASQARGLAPTDTIEAEQRLQLAALCDDDIECAEDAERNIMRLEWYAEKQAAAWIVETLNMLPLDSRLSSLRKTLVGTRKVLFRRIAEIEEAVGFDLVMYRES
jgi:hypothetical protein